ncbi:MAG: precorrin-6y C5,15-methyltransferase (decarboxylating) subunit CbiE [Desulfarculus sp.]|nr:precorrin-6y C5,15-methyltransferase (decarboxylating) subunit CbiE [Desulfarculus sp.]
MIPFQVVGVGMGIDDLPAKSLRAIEQAQVLAGGRRLLDMFPQHLGQRLVLEGRLESWLRELARLAQDQRVAVLASGDPGFFGIAQRLTERLGPEALVIHPNVTSVQAAFARLKEPWQDVRVVSLHGRGLSGLLPALAGRERVAVLTDPQNTPAAIARLLLERGQAGWRLWVLEDLGGPQERVGEYTLEQAAGAKFSPLNLVVLKRLAWPAPLRLGLPEEAFEHQAGLITKAEVRAVALAKLELGPGLTLWDLGAGCGSLGLEASLLLPGGSIVAVERAPERVAMIEANRRRFGVATLEVVRAELPQGLQDLAGPDRVFIGGGGAALGDIIKAALERLAPGGVVVVAAVRLEALESARAALAQGGLEVEVTQVQVSRGAPLGGGSFLKALNPVWLIKGRRREPGAQA